jgi:hypothetical protein
MGIEQKGKLQIENCKLKISNLGWASESSFQFEIYNFQFAIFLRPGAPALAHALSPRIRSANRVKLIGRARAASPC